MELTNEEKIDIINAHIRSSLENSFNIRLNIVEEGSASEPNEENLKALYSLLAVEESKQRALQNEIDKLNNGESI